MIYKICSLFFALVIANFCTIFPAQSATKLTVAVIDVGANTSLFTNIVTEVCIVEMLACPNGKNFMEGQGAADTGVPKHKSFDHGTNMLSIINRINPEIGLIPIRIVATTTNGYPGLYSNKAVKQGLDWVLENQTKYNIVAVNVSQGKIFSNCAVPEGTAAVIALLKVRGVAVIASAGNDSNKNSMMSIACLPDVISIGATDNPDPGVSGLPFCKNCSPTIARYSNGNPSFYTNGRWYVTQGNGSTKFTAGSSNSTAAFTALWVKNYQGNYLDTFSLISSLSTVITNADRIGKYVFIPQS